MLTFFLGTEVQRDIVGLICMYVLKNTRENMHAGKKLARAEIILQAQLQPRSDLGTVGYSLRGSEIEDAISGVRKRTRRQENSD